MYGYDEITTMDKRELHAFIANAVKEGILAAMQESGKRLYPDSERPRESDGDTDNARAYLFTVRNKLDKDSFIGRYGGEGILKEMRSLCDDDEIKYILTHLDSGYTPKCPRGWKGNTKSLKTVWVERDS